MYILTVAGIENEGSYAFVDDDGDHILYLFEGEDDAIRYALMLEDEGSPEMHVIEVEDDVMIKTCDLHDYKYTVISPNDVVIPPNSKNDLV